MLRASQLGTLSLELGSGAMSSFLDFPTYFSSPKQWEEQTHIILFTDTRRRWPESLEEGPQCVSKGGHD